MNLCILFVVYVHYILKKGCQSFEFKLFFNLVLLYCHALNVCVLQMTTLLHISSCAFNNFSSDIYINKSFLHYPASKNMCWLIWCAVGKLSNKVGQLQYIFLTIEQMVLPFLNLIFGYFFLLQFQARTFKGYFCLHMEWFMVYRFPGFYWICAELIRSESLPCNTYRLHSSIQSSFAGA